MKRLIILDLDGTILDTLDDLTDSINAALSQAGLPLRTREETRAVLGNGARRVVGESVPAGTEEAVTEQVFAFFTRYYAAHCEEKTGPYEGLTEALIYLKEQGCRLAVISNKPDPAVKKLCGAYFPGLFDTACGERPGIRRKPAPDAVDAVREELGFAREETIYVGDSEVDIQTAENAGILCLSVSWGFRSVEELGAAGATQIIDRPEQLRELGI